MQKKTLIRIFLLLFLTDSLFLFSQNLTMDGYKGIWYQSGQLQEYGYKFSGGAATFASRHRPIAIYSPAAKKTFFVYGGTTSPEERHLLIMISYYDHKTHLVPKPVIVYDKMGVREPHDNASLQIDSDGYLWVFVSGRFRTRPGIVFKSSKPYSIESFNKMKEWEMISPQPWWMGDQGFLLMFSRMTNGREIYFASSRDGINWGIPEKIAGLGGHYQVSNILGNKLVTVFNYHPGGDADKRTNLYLLQTEDMGKSWKNIDGKIIQTPITDKKTETLIKDYETEGKQVYINDLIFDEHGNPVILVILSDKPGPQGGPKEWVVVHRVDQKWVFSKVCESHHSYDMGSLYITKDEWRIIGTTEPGPQKSGTGGEVALWVSRDNGFNWEKERNITENSKMNNSFVRSPLNPQKDFYSLWTDGNTDSLSISSLYFTNEKCNGVWVLPYEMKKEKEKPVRIK